MSTVTLEPTAGAPATETNSPVPPKPAPESTQRIRLGPLLAICAGAWLLRVAVPIPAGLDAKSLSLLIVLLAALAGLILQPAPMGVVFLSSITVAVLTSVLTPTQALAGYSNNILWLIVIAFMFARAFVKTGLGRRIALLIIRQIGTSSLRLGYALSLTDLVLAPVTASNTARTGAIVFPIAVSLSREFDSNPGPTASRIGSFLLFTAYQANLVTSALFLTAMASNPVAAEFARQIAGVHISWGSWLAASWLPGALTFLAVPYLIYRWFPPTIRQTPTARAYAERELVTLGPASPREWALTLVFIGLAIVWATQSLHGIDTTVTGLAGLCVLLLSGVLAWSDIVGETRAWDTFVWWGAMMSLATALNQSLVPKWFATIASHTLAGWPALAALVAVVIAYTYIHYAFAGQTAHVVALYPAFLTVAVAAGAPPLLSALLLCFFSNLNSTLTHYSDGAAPVYYGSGYIDQRSWWRIGFYLSVVHLLVWIGIGLPWWKFLGIW
jgi:DASS family divalent anion:Na+ symporter